MPAPCGSRQDVTTLRIKSGYNKRGAEDCARDCPAQKPTPAMRALSMAGSGLFLGIVSYFWFQERPQPQRRKQ